MPIRDVDGSRQDPPVLWKKHVCWAAESCAGVKSRSGEARERKELLKKGLYLLKVEPGSGGQGRLLFSSRRVRENGENGTQYITSSQ